MGHEVYSVQTPKDLGIMTKRHGDIEAVLQLNKKELARSASRWELCHLIAYRLLVRQEGACLPVLETDHDGQCPIFKDNQLCHQKLDHARTKALTAENRAASARKSNTSSCTYRVEFSGLHLRGKLVTNLLTKRECTFNAKENMWSGRATSVPQARFLVPLRRYYTLHPSLRLAWMILIKMRMKPDGASLRK